MKTILELDPQFERSRETFLAYASKIYGLSKPAQSTNSALCLADLCTFQPEMRPSVRWLQQFWTQEVLAAWPLAKKILYQVHCALPIKLSGHTMADLKLT